MQKQPKKLFKTHNPYKVKRRKANKLYSDADLTDADKMSSLYVQYTQQTSAGKCRKLLLKAERLFGSKLPLWAKQELKTLRKLKRNDNEKYIKNHRDKIEENNNKWNGYFSDLNRKKKDGIITEKEEKILKRQKESILNCLKRKKISNEYGLRNNSAFKANQPNDNDQNCRKRNVLFPVIAPINVLSNDLSNDCSLPLL